MPSVTAFQTNFSAGELSPRLYGRVDIGKYMNGCHDVQNMVIQRFGGARKRGGTQFINEVKTSSAQTRLISFIFSVTQAYVLEFGNLYVRIYTNGGVVTSGGNPVEVTTPYTTSQLFDLQFAQSADVLYITHPSHAPRKFSRLSATSFSLETIVFEDGPFLELNTTATTLAPATTGHFTPAMTGQTSPSGTVSGSSSDGYFVFDREFGTQANLNDASSGYVQYDLGSGQSKIPNAYWIVSSANAFTQDMPTGWSMSGSNNGSTWVVLDTQENQTGWASNEKRYFRFGNDAAFRYIRFDFFGGGGDDGSPTVIAEIAVNEDGASMTPFTLTASSTSGINDGAGFLASDVGRMIRILGGDGRWRWCRIITRSSSTVVTVRMYGHALPDTRPILNWRMGAWSATTGWPASVSFYSGRLAFARTATQPQTVWMSRVDDFTDFSVSDPIQDDDAITATIASDSLNEIKWIAEGTELFVGTTAAIRTIGPTTASAAFSPTNIQQKRQANFGASNVLPVRVGNTALYSGYYRKDIREIAFSFDVDGYISQDLGILSEHLTSPGIKQMAYAQNPDSIVWMVLDDGTFVGMTYERDQEVVAFHRHVIGGTSVTVESVATIPGTAGDEVWIIVRRTINGSTKRYIERVSVGLTDTEVPGNSRFLDSHLTYTGTLTSTITGLSHLEGQQVYTWGTGFKQGPFTVSGGSITTTTPVTFARVGLPYTSVVETLSPEAGARGGTAQSRQGRISEVFVRVNRSMHGSIGPSDGTLEAFDYTKSIDEAGNYGSATAMYTGDVRVPIAMDWNRQKRIRLEHSEPSPFHVLGFITELRVSG